VERRGGRVTVQDPAEADYGSMPRGAIAATAHPIVTPAADLAGQVTRLAKDQIRRPVLRGGRGGQAVSGRAPRGRGEHDHADTGT
jgi:hypothetical protein